MEESDNLIKIQKIELNILEEFIRICDKYGLKWFLVEGSLLGAVRHQGMIPWDDDVDVALFRDDYERFLEVVRDELPEQLKCRNYRWNPEYIECMTKMVDTRHAVRSLANGKTVETDVWIDIFVIDGIPTGKISGKLHRFRLLARKLFVMWSDIDHYVTDRKRPAYEELLIKIAKAFRTDRIIDTHKAMKALDRLMASVPVTPEGKTVNFLSEYRFKTVCDASCFGSGIITDFAGLGAIIPEQYDLILKQEYGDYSILPPEDKRYKHRLELIR